MVPRKFKERPPRNPRISGHIPSTRIWDLSVQSRQEFTNLTGKTHLVFRPPAQTLALQYIKPSGIAPKTGHKSTGLSPTIEGGEGVIPHYRAMGIHEEPLFENRNRTRLKRFERTMRLLRHISHRTRCKRRFPQDSKVPLRGLLLDNKPGTGASRAPPVRGVPVGRLDRNETAEALGARGFVHFPQETPDIGPFACAPQAIRGLEARVVTLWNLHHTRRIISARE